MQLKDLDMKLLIGISHTPGEESKVLDLLKGYRIPSTGPEFTPNDLANSKLSQVRGEALLGISQRIL